MITQKDSQESKIFFKGEKFSFTVKNETKNDAEICLYGYIGPWEAVDYKKFQNDFRQVLLNNKNVTIRIHSGGGSIYEGLAIYDLMRSSNSRNKVIIEGMAASMAGVIAIGGDEIEMTENAFFMAHAVSGGYYGNKRGFISFVQQLESCENRLISIFKERTNIDEQIIQSWFNSDQDTWLDSAKCIEFGICDNVIKPTKKRVFQENDNPENIYSRFDSKEFKNTIDRKGWTFNDWQQNDAKGLEKLSISDPEKFKTLFANEYQPSKSDSKIIDPSAGREIWTLQDWQENDMKGLKILNEYFPDKIRKLLNNSNA